MSGSDRDSRPKRPVSEAVADDPWAKWRKPEAPAAEAEPKKEFRRDAVPPESLTPESGNPWGAVDREKRPKTKSFDAAPARAARVETPVAAPVEVKTEAPY